MCAYLWLLQTGFNISAFFVERGNTSRTIGLYLLNFFYFFFYFLRERKKKNHPLGYFHFHLDTSHQQKALQCSIHSESGSSNSTTPSCSIGDEPHPGMGLMKTQPSGLAARIPVIEPRCHLCSVFPS